MQILKQKIEWHSSNDKRTWDEFYKLLVLHDLVKVKSWITLQKTESIIQFVKGSLQEVAQKAGIDVAGLSETVQNTMTMLNKER